MGQFSVRNFDLKGSIPSDNQHTTLRENMFADFDDETRNAKIVEISHLFANNSGRAHNTHIQVQQCRDLGLAIEMLEDDQKLQDLVLTLHHCYMHTLSNTMAYKVVENQLGKAMVRQQQQQFIMAAQPSQGMPIDFLLPSQPTQPTPPVEPAQSPDSPELKPDHRA